MKKGQGTKQRKTLFEAIHGAAASPEVEAHLAILTQYRKAVVVLAVKKQLMAKEWPGFEARHIEAQTQRVHKLKDLAFESWERVAKQPGTLRKLADIAARKRDGNGAAYPEEKIVLEAYASGERSRAKLLAIARRINPHFSDSDMSELTKRYNLTGIKKGKPGRKSKHPTHTEEVEALMIKWLEGAWTNKQFQEKLDGIQEAYLDRLEAQEKIPSPEQLAEIERQWWEKQKRDAMILAQGARLLAERERKKR